MNPKLQSAVQHAWKRGWFIPPDPNANTAQQYTREIKRSLMARLRATRYAQGLNWRGQPRQRARTIPQCILDAAAGDGVGVTAIYNRLKRTGQLTLRKRK